MENWKYLNENYKVSDLGNVFSVRNSIILKLDNRGGYKRISINIGNGIKQYGVHQLVAMAFLGHRPDGTNKVVVDHINNNKLDNRLENLRLISNRQNLSRRGGASKYVGVSKFRNKWMSTIRVNGKLEYLGLYQTEENAHRAYIKRLNEI